MDWIPLIASTARLIDLHDSSRSAGLAASQYDLNREARGGNHDGLWLDVALTTIEYLREREGEVAGGFVSGTEVRDTLQQRVTGLTAEDVRFVLSALTTPSELWFIERTVAGGRPVNSTKDTCLVERSRTADAYRLAPAGRTASSLAANVRDIAYIAGSAKNLLTAIEARDFGKIAELATAIVDVLRAFRMDIESRREGGRPSDIQTFFRERGDVIKEQIDDAARILTKAHEQLSLPSKRDEFLAWVARREHEGKSSFGHGYAIDQLRRVAAQTLKLLESFTQLVEASLQADDEAFEAISFTDLSARLAAQPYQEGLYNALIRTFGATQMRRPMPCAFDYFGTVEPRRVADVSPEDRDVDGSEHGSAGILRFMGEHRDAILAALRKGPLPLVEALQRDWVRLDAAGSHDLSGLIGVYGDPSMLDSPANITVRLGEGRDAFDHPGSGRWSFDALLMVLEEA